MKRFLLLSIAFILIFILSSCKTKEDYSQWNFSEAAKNAASRFYSEDSEEYKAYCLGFEDGMQYLKENGYEP